jgi:pyruvate/2-oxoglutarate dehydrogenase complex dihydrolipoamide acyltransferase (E2) component
VNVEIESPDDGQLEEISAQEGDFVKFGAVVAVIEK